LIARMGSRSSLRIKTKKNNRFAFLQNPQGSVAYKTPLTEPNRVASKANGMPRDARLHNSGAPSPPLPRAPPVEMVLAKGKLADDPRDISAVKPFNRPKLKDDELPPDLWALGALVFGVCGSMLHWKGCAWVAVIFATAAMCNKRVYDSDWKQIWTSVMFAFSGLFINSLNAYNGRDVNGLRMKPEAVGAEAGL